MRHLFTSSSSFLSTGILRPLRALHYVQGQSPEPKIREYFYYIDHQGQVKQLLGYLLKNTENFIYLIMVSFYQSHF